MNTLTGALTFSTVPALLTQAERWIAAGTLDLSAVAHTDSAGVSMLLELSRRAQTKGIQLRITGANDQIRSLLKFFALDGILALA
jgi:phospholipid transport system transporter-binding protein